MPRLSDFIADQDFLTRHRARLLIPSTAAPAFDDNGDLVEVLPTAYRYDSLVAPPELLTSQEFSEFQQLVARTFSQLGLVNPFANPEGKERVQRTLTPFGSRGTGVLLLRPDPRVDVPQPLDAWVALQALRGAVRREGIGREEIRQVSLNYLLLSHNGFLGDPAESPHHGHGSRRPISGAGMYPPERCPEPARRVTVAVLDTSVAEHNWFGAGAFPALLADGSLPAGAADPFVVTAGTALPGISWVAEDPTGVTVSPGTGELDHDCGHGTFIAGLIRQIAPQARVLTLPAMSGDGGLDTASVCQILQALLTFVRQRTATSFVDVLNLSFGQYPAELDPGAATWLAQLLTALGDEGVLVVASAGNDSTNRQCLPAAFADLPTQPNRVPVVSVGARNPNGSQALFSNYGSWVHAWAPGVEVLSTVPPTFQGSLSAERSFLLPGLGSPLDTKCDVDPDDFSAGLGTWSGTSFAAPYVAAVLARRLAKGGGDDPSNTLTATECTARALATLADWKATVGGIDAAIYL